ncbi:MAG: hypothetical protein K9H41_04380 [Bacteroidia bacterium]|nr:hypothetical protein [Bacteroidia bacterium]
MNIIAGLILFYTSYKVNKKFAFKNNGHDANIHRYPAFGLLINLICLGLIIGGIYLIIEK